MPDLARRAIVRKPGGPEVLEWVEEPINAPGEGQVTVRHEAVGVNYIDIYHRNGTYQLPLPTGIGVEGAGVVEAVGPGVSGLNAGDRIAYVGGPPGAYATVRMIPAARVVKLPEDVAARDAAALIFKGLTVEYLIRRCYRVQAGDVVLLHAAAGGIGLIACQWLRHLGATIIGTVGSEEKAELARAHGCQHTVIYTKESFAERVKELTQGQGVAVVYDSIGKDTFEGSLQSLRTRGTFVSFGSSSGPTPAFDLAELGAKGSLYATRPSIAHYTAKRDELETAANALFDMIRGGIIKAAETRPYPMREASQAHRDLEARKTTGSLLLVP
jgi:NADPH:quinone reductase